MAQPVFDQHPLEEYFELAGETAQIMPGIAPEFAIEQEVPMANSRVARIIIVLLSSCVLKGIELADTFLPSSQFSSVESSFAERFKYDVISSTLLSNTLAGTPGPSRRTSTTDIPGRMDHNSTHSRTSSVADQDFSRRSRDHDAGHAQLPTIMVSIAVVSLSVGSYFLALALLGGALYFALPHQSKTNRVDAISQTQDALSELISAGNVWDSAVAEGMAIVEKEERRPNTFFGPTSPHSPLSGLRVTLQSSLHTTETQCDNVRQLLSALTSPTQLAQLSEMYAPASPIKPSFMQSETHSPSLSEPVAMWRKRTTSAPSSQNDKRATWNGSYVSLAAAGSPNFTAMKRLDRRRSELASIFNSESASKSSYSAPASPQNQRVLANVQEEDGRPDPELTSLQEECFGMAALDMRRKRRSSGMEAFGIPPPSYSSQTSHGGHNPNQLISNQSYSASVASSSRFTLMHTSRHPLSLSALHLALQGAVAAKRYSCSHLLALRFNEDEDDMYWEDVRSIMTLLTSTFSDASSRLFEALDETEKRRMKDERPSAESLNGHSREGSMSPSAFSRRSSLGIGLGILPGRNARTMSEMLSFAPMPSHLTRFAAHVDSISSALNEARDYLEECVASLRQPSEKDPFVASEGTPDAAGNEHTLSLALEAYDRLRKELGFALRECERGRERLLDIVAASQPVQEDEDKDIEDPPLLARDDSSSEGSDQHDASSSKYPSGLDVGLANGDGTLGLSVIMEQESQPVDDASEHLLLTTSSQHLPPPGIEQVYEAESGVVGTFTRERSKLSREDRIRLAKARRESGGSCTAESPLTHSRRASAENWGPGGEVVQELKDVIWKVSEKRRKMSERRESWTPSVSVLAVDSSRTDVSLPVVDLT